MKHYKKPYKKPVITWKALLSIDEIRAREARWGRYVVLYTDATTICCSEHEAEKLCLYEPYLLSGDIKIRPGGMYLHLNKAELFDPQSFNHVIL